jgi:hypothetical protein
MDLIYFQIGSGRHSRVDLARFGLRVRAGSRGSGRWRLVGRFRSAIAIPKVVLGAATNANWHESEDGGR